MRLAKLQPRYSNRTLKTLKTLFCQILPCAEMLHAEHAAIVFEHTPAAVLLPAIGKTIARADLTFRRGEPDGAEGTDGTDGTDGTGGADGTDEANGTDGTSGTDRRDRRDKRDRRDRRDRREDLTFDPWRGFKNLAVTRISNFSSGADLNN